MATKHPEIILVPKEMDSVSCSGNTHDSHVKHAGALGHPKVFYSFHGQEEVVCGYCDRLFTKTAQPGAKPWSKSVA